MARHRNRRPPAIVPPGWYDPSLDAARRASHRGLGDLTRDTELAGSRASQDYTFGVQNLTTDRDRARQDIGRQVQMLTRNYQELGRSQGEQDAVAGVINPAIAAKQMQIRAANMAVDRQPLDTALSRANTDFETNKGRMGVDFFRGAVDRATGLRRANREDTQYGLDIGNQERFQAIQAGWLPPNDPRRKKGKPRVGTWRPSPGYTGPGSLAGRPIIHWPGPVHF